MPHASSEFVAFPSRSDLLRTPRLILECISPPQFHSMRVDSRVLKGTANPNDQGVDDDAHQGIYEVFPHSVALLIEAARTQHNHAYYDHSVYCFIEMYDTWRAFVKSTLSSAQGNATHVVLTMLTVREFFDGVLFLHLAIGSVLHSAGEDLQALRQILTCVDLLVFFGSSFLTSSYPCDSEYFCAHQYEKQKSTFVTRCEVLIEKEYRNQIPASEQEEWTFLKSACDLDTDTIQELMDSIENESNLISPETYEWCSTAGTAHSRAQSQNPERAPRKIRCIQEDIPNKRHQFFLAHAYSWLGILYFRLSMFDYALDYFHRCLEIREYHLIHSALEHRRSCVTCRLGIIQVLNNIAVALSMLSKHDGDALDSIRLLERAESMCADHAAHSLPARTDETRPIQDIAQDPFCSTTMLSSIPVRARIIAQNLRILRRLCTVALPQRLLDGATRSSGGTSSHSMGTLGSAENLKWSGVQSVLMGRGEHVPLIPGAKLSIRQANASQSKAGAKKKTKKKK